MRRGACRRRAPLAAVAAVFAILACDPGRSLGPPGVLRADFSFDPPNPRVGVRVTYSGAISSGDITGYRWDVDGDGSFDTDFRGVDTVSHVYRKDGLHRVTLQVRARDGALDSETRRIPIDP